MVKRFKPEPNKIDDGIPTVGGVAIAMCLLILCLSIVVFW